ncbi:hypothetical protein [Nocardia niigatensis]|uniref:hypothetical protein n=1 Tax=Nocardia niigatensis TaxID=209249 RepID=UPI0012F67EFC|nr:hypothetical protein [Nocardia niigatensis]
MTASDRKPPAPLVNPIVRAAADQVAKSKRRRKAAGKDIPRTWICEDQLSLFDSTEGTQS